MDQDQNNNNIEKELDTGVDNEIVQDEIVQDEIAQDEIAQDEIAQDEIADATNVTDGAKKVKAPSGVLVTALDVFEIFALSMVAVLLIFTFCIRLCRVDGGSMNNTLHNGEMLITSDLFYTPKQGDIVVFHLSNESFQKPLVKRVIATAGQTVSVNFTSGEVRVDGTLQNETYVFLEGGSYDISPDFDRKYIYHVDGEFIFEITVPDGKIFVMGDNRNNSSDSRSASVGLIDTDTVLGRALFRISPFTIFE